MRVRVTETTRAYWNYQVHDLQVGFEVDGEFAEHLWNVQSPVEVVDGTPPDPTPDEADPADNPAPESEPEPDDPDDEPPVDATIETLMTWVGTDPTRAATALAAEQAKDAPRGTAVKRLAAIVDTTED